MPSQILSLGSVNADFQLRAPQPLRPGTSLLASGFSRLGGGKAANVAFLARRLGHSAVLLGRVGDDTLAEQALGPLRPVGVALDHVTVAPNMATAVSMIVVPPDGKKTIVLASNANDTWDAAAIDTAVGAIQHAPSGSLLVADCEISPLAVSRVMSAAHARRLRIILDPAPADRVTPDLMRLCFALTPDAHEATALTGIDAGDTSGAIRACAALAARGIGLACVKLSDGGCIAAFAGSMVHLPPVTVDVVDTTGAGDAFTGALAVALLRDRPLDQAVLFATAASHLAITQWGSQQAYPTDQQIATLLPRLADGMHHVRG